MNVGRSASSRHGGNYAKHAATPAAQATQDTIATANNAFCSAWTFHGRSYGVPLSCAAKNATTERLKSRWKTTLSKPGGSPHSKAAALASASLQDVTKAEWPAPETA